MTGREKLRRLAQDIAGLLQQERLLSPTVPTISPELGKWFIRAVHSRDIAKAMGITRGKGRPRDNKKEQRAGRTYKMAKQAFLIKRENPKKTFKQIAMDTGAPDGEWLRKAYNHHRRQLEIEDLTARLIARPFNLSRRKN